MTNPKVPPEIRCWQVTLDAVHWQTDANWSRRLKLSRFDSLLQLRHRTLAIVIDLDWFDPDARASQAATASSTGKFRLRVIQNEDWENPIDGYHIIDAATLDDALQRLIVRYG